MNKQTFVENVKRAENIMLQYKTRLAAINPDLKPEAQAAKKQQIIAELVEHPEGLRLHRRLVREGIAEFRAERELASDTEAALMTAAWNKASDLSPGALAVLESAKTASPARLAQFLDLAAQNPAAVAVLGHHVQMRKDELEAQDAYGLLFGKVQTLAGSFVDHTKVKELAAIEHRGLALEMDAMIEVDHAAPEERLTVGREVVALEALINAS